MFAHVPPVLIPFIAITLPVAMPPPTGVTAAVGSCHDVTLRWTQPSEPNDITTSVNCTPPSSGCAACTSSPCNITDLTPNTDYNFTVTLNSQKCGTTSSAIAGKTEGEIECGIGVRITATCISCVLWQFPTMVLNIISYFLNQRFPQFRGHLMHYSATLGYRMVPFLCWDNSIALN